ncbi:MAG: hypothetical protein MJZ00_04575 [Paludibacteraceae bacterium]|nr:hypothetical protein [Paludibacteraceae bacterium]
MKVKINMKKRTFFAVAGTFFAATELMAGGIVSNTNQHAAYQRNFAREATTEIDAAYSNPAGLAWKNDGWELAFSYQATIQERNIESTSPSFSMNADGDGSATRSYKGDIVAPFIPSLQAAYKKNRWAFYTNIAVSGGGGSCKFDDGMASTEILVSALPSVANAVFGRPMFNQYSVESQMEGSQYIFSMTLGTAFKFDDHFSASVGLRGNYALNRYEGYVKNIKVNNPLAPGEMVAPAELAAGMVKMGMVDAQTAGAVGGMTADKEIDCEQSGFGVAPILGIAVNFDRVRFGAKYEFRTKIEIENKSEKDGGMPAYADGQVLRSDIPAILATGLDIDILKPLTLGLSYRHYFDNAATIDAFDKEWYNKCDYAGKGTNDIAGALEWRINDKWTVSGTVMRTLYGVEDRFQSDLNFSLDCWSFGGGFKFSPRENIDINVAYFGVNYDDDYTKVYAPDMAARNPGRTDVCNRVANSFAAGINFRFGGEKSSAAEVETVE